MGTFGRRVFGGPPEDGDPGFGVRSDQGSYRLDVGELAGVTMGAEVAVYGSEPAVLPAVNSEQDQFSRKGSLIVTSAGPSWAQAMPAPGVAAFDLPPGARARVVRLGHQSRLLVGLDPSDGALRDALASGRSSLIRLAGSDERPAVVLKRCKNGEWALTDDLYGTGDDQGEPWLARVAGDDAQAVIAMLEHYQRYIAPWEMSKRCSDLPAGSLHVRLLDCVGRAFDDDGIIVDSNLDAQSPALPEKTPREPGLYELREGMDWHCYEVQNHHTRPLFVTLIECGASGRVNILCGGEAEVPAQGRHVFWWEATPKKVIGAFVPPDKLVGIDRLVAIGTTARDKTLSFFETSTSFADIRALFERKRDGAPGPVLRDSRGGYPSTERWVAERLVIHVNRVAA
jgi:hypothetical protein